MPVSKKRGRIVMLVDNPVTADSRVQKEARSAADRGWEVILLGHQRAGAKPSWRLGKAQVRLITVDTPMNKRHHLRRSARLRSPLSYGRVAAAEYRRHSLRAQQVDLQNRRAVFQLKTAGRESAVVTRLGRGVLFVQRARLGLTRRWVELRADKTAALEKRRQAMESPLDRFTTAFWVKTMGDRAWRQLDPNLWDWELAYGPEIDRLKPDIIHANDFRMLGVGARAMLRARSRGRDTKLVWDAHEFLPGIKPWNPHPRWHLAQCAHEREYAGYADAVVTVSEPLADLLIKEHGLTKRPTVVLNAPEAIAVDELKSGRSIRASCGLEPEVPLLVYSGTASVQRGLDVMIEALPQLPEVHVALVVSQPRPANVATLVKRAAELGVQSRLHLVPYVPATEVASFLSSADIGVIPIHHYPNHEIALITKFFEYSHARLPIVVSDVRLMSDKVRETGQGEVFVAKDVPDYVRAVNLVLADPEKYRSVYDQPGLLAAWTWDAAADLLDGVYSTLRAEQSR